MVIETQPAKFSADKTKVLYLCSHLRGPAYSWAQSFIETLRTANEHPCLSNFDDFVKMLRAAFGDPDPRATARRDLFRLHQGNSSAADYAAAFQRAAVRTKWNPEALKDIFDEGLNDELRRELSTRDLPDNFLDYVPKVIALDNQMREYRFQRGQSGRKFPPSFNDYRHRPSNFSLKSLVIQDLLRLKESPLISRQLLIPLAMEVPLQWKLALCIKSSLHLLLKNASVASKINSVCTVVNLGIWLALVLLSLSTQKKSKTQF